MTTTDHPIEEPADREAGRELWQRCRDRDVVSDESERFVDLAAFADGALADEEERARIAALVAADPVARADVAAARALTQGGIAMAGALDRVVARASALATAPGIIRATVAPPHRRGWIVRGAAQWAGLAAAIAVTGWLGFAMGSDASLSLTTAQPAPQQIGEDGFLPELLDPSTGFLRDLGEGQRT